MNLFKKNLQALKEVDESLAKKLKQIKSNKKYEVFVGNDPANINIIDMEKKEPLYLGQPVEETISSLENLRNKQKYPFLYFFGLGNGILFKLIFETFISLKRVTVFEPELEIIYIVLNLVDLSDYIKEEKLQIIHLQDLNFTKAISIFVKKDSTLYSKLYSLEITTPYYVKKYKNKIIEVNSLMTRAIEHLIFSVGNDTIDSLIGLEHHILNVEKMLETPPFQTFINKAKNSDIAVIVSTGPSLMKQLPLLKEIQNNVSILSVDASFPILYKHGIKPDFVFSLERVEATAGFYENLPKEAFEGVTFLITSIAHKKLLENIKGGNLQINMRPFRYLMYFENDPWGYLGKGMSAANMAFEFAYYAEYEKVVLIGQDLAFGEDGASHAKEHTRGTKDVHKNIQTVTLPAYGGKGEVKSTAIWKAFRNFFEDDISQTKEKMTTYNATEGGARIEGAIEIPFKEFIEKFVDKNKIKKPILFPKPNKKLSKEHKEIFYENLNKMHKKVKEVKEECEATFLEVVGFLEEIEELNRQNRLEEIDFQKGLNILDQIDKIKNHFEDKEFFSLVFEFVRSYIINQELEIAKIQVKNIQNEMDQKVQILEWLYAHKPWLFFLAGGLDAILVVIERSAKEKLKLECEAS